MNLATLKKLVLGYIVAVPVLIVITIVQFMSVQRVVDAHRRLGTAHDVIRQADALEAALSEAETSLKIFLDSQKTDALTAYQGAPVRTREILDKLVTLTSGDAEQLARVKKLEGGVSTRLELFQKVLETQPMPAPKPSTREKPVPPNEAEAQGKQIMAEVTKILSQVRRQESDRFPTLIALAGASVERANRLAPIAGVLAIWMVLFAALLLYRDTSRRAWAGIERRIHTRVVETLPIGVCLVDEHGLILYTNAAQDMLFGYEPGGLVGRHVTSTHHAARGEGDELFDQAMEGLRSQGEWRGDFVAKRKNSTTFNCVTQAVTMEMSGKMYRLFLMASGAATQPAA
jgi:PAS domain S-box-containing protein